MCRECSSDVYTISGHRNECPDCGRRVDWKNDPWWWMPTPPEPQQGGTSGSVSQAVPSQDPSPVGDQAPKRKRKRGGKKHRKGSPPRTAPGQVDDSDDRVRRHDDDESSGQEETVRAKRSGGVDGCGEPDG